MPTNPPDIETLRRLLENWQSAALNLESLLLQIEAVFLCAPENPLYSAVNQALGNYTDALATLLGDEFKWLEYYAHECRYGRKPHTVTFNTTGKSVDLDSIDTLIEVLLEP